MDNKVIELKYGNTRTYIVKGNQGALLIDTDWAGTVHNFFKALKQSGESIKTLNYLVITHFHPDHMGIAANLNELGIRLIVLEEQRDFLHTSDYFFEKEKNSSFIPLDIHSAILLPCSESRSFLAQIGIQGEIIYTPGHSDDSISIILDNGIAIVGDLPPIQLAPGFEKADMDESWRKILAHGIDTIHYGHAMSETIDKNLRSLQDL